MTRSDRRKQQAVVLKARGWELVSSTKGPWAWVHPSDPGAVWTTAAAMLSIEKGTPRDADSGALLRCRICKQLGLENEWSKPSEERPSSHGFSVKLKHIPCGGWDWYSSTKTARVNR